MEFPNECSRCGVCCLMEVCKIGLHVFQRSKESTSQCQGLTFKDNIATCSLSNIVPLGDGCCIKARAYKDGVEYDFALLSKDFKIKAANDIIKRRREE